jgi:uncharacterized protein YjiK
MKKYLIVGTALVVLISVLGYFFFFSKEVDDIAENGPIRSKIIPKMDQIPLFENMLAAGVSWDYDNDRFFISTDQPHGLFTEKVASFYVVNTTLDQILYRLDIDTDGDLEGIAYIGNNEVAIISEVGTIHYMKEKNNEWKERSRVTIFNGNGKHKLGSLAYDPINQHLYSAEKEGRKIIYQISRSGSLINSFEFSAGDIAAKRDFNFDRDYTIAGMTYSNQHLYIFSEAYSTIFKYNPKIKELVTVYGVKDIHESAGITLKEGVAYLVGDFESYLPAPSFYKVDIPD